MLPIKDYATLDRWKDIMKELDEEWVNNFDEMMACHNKIDGVRSSQVAALVYFLIKKGIIK